MYMHSQGKSKRSGEKFGMAECNLQPIPDSLFKAFRKQCLRMVTSRERVEVRGLRPENAQGEDHSGALAWRIDYSGKKQKRKWDKRVDFLPGGEEITAEGPCRKRGRSTVLPWGVGIRKKRSVSLEGSVSVGGRNVYSGKKGLVLNYKHMRKVNGVGLCA